MAKDGQGTHAPYATMKGTRPFVMSKLLLPTQRLLRPLLWASLVVLVLLVAASLGPIERLQQLRSDRAATAHVPKELSTLWEVWKIVVEDYGGKEKVDQRTLSEGAIQGMVSVLGDKAATYLTPADYDLNAPNMEAVWQAWRVLSPKLREENASVTTQVLQEAAIKGMLHALGNPYTTYLLPDEYDLETQSLSSKFDGIGIYVTVINNQLAVAVPIADSPAERAGLVTGDIILEVDGSTTTNMTIAEAARRIRGPRGSSVELLVLHEGDGTPRRIPVTRDVVKLQTVTWQSIGEGLAYLRISQFLDDTDEDVENALKEMVAQNVAGLILDLRRNPGGLLDTTVAVASQFLEDGLVLYQVDGHGKRTDLPVLEGGAATKIPMVVLADQASASASEILGGTLQDHHRAVLIGTKTYGKGSVNEFRRLKDGSGVYMTSALWYSPDGRLIEGEGLTPDIEVPMDLGIPLGSSFDWQLYSAIQYLTGRVPSAAR
ncbi:MAG: S41 family peptidase [Dehalococcoidia bacterium]|nr:S41 family peptidase [Dehalococcoidia bacterium]